MLAAPFEREPHILIPPKSFGIKQRLTFDYLKIYFCLVICHKLILSLIQKCANVNLGMF